MTRVLAVEDERTLARYLADGLRDEGMAADVCHDGAAARRRWKAGPQRPDGPMVLLLTAATAVEDRVDGLRTRHCDRGR